MLQDKYAKVRNKLDHTYALPPRTLYFTVTNRCNANCIMCDVPKDVGHMPVAQYRKVVDEAATWKPTIYLNAMEPLEHPEIADMIGYAKFRELQVVLSTNGILLSKQIGTLTPNFIWVGIDGVGSKHDEIRGVECYEKATEGIKKALEVGVNVGVIYCINERNYGDLVETAEAMKELGVKQMVSAHLNYFDGKPKDVNIDKLEYQTLVATNIITEGDDRRFLITLLPMLTTKEQVDAWYHHPRQPIRGDYSCGAVSNGMQITPNGEAMVGFRCFADSRGNVFDEGLLHVWNSKRYREFRKFIKQGIVPHCYRCCSLYSGG